MGQRTAGIILRSYEGRNSFGTLPGFEDLRRQIDDYMDYYNKDRYQWALAKLSPNQYENYLKTGIYPIVA